MLYLKKHESVQGLPAKRAVVFSLPEFGRLQFEQFRKIVAGCLPTSEWWTWLGQEWVFPVIGGLRNGEAWRELWKAFEREANHSFGSELFALSFFSRVIPSNAPEHPDFVAFVSAALLDDKLAKRAIEVVLLHELPVDLKVADEKELVEALRTLPYGRRGRHPAVITELVKRLPRPVALRWLCTTQHRYPWIVTEASVWKFMELPVESRSIDPVEINASNGPKITIIYPEWLRLSIQGEGHLPLSESLDTGGDYAAYIGALFASLQQPHDPARYQEAQAAMVILPEELAWTLRCEYVLGPSPDQFSSADDWLRFKADVRGLFGKQGELSILYDVASTFGAAVDNHENEWMAFLFPPSQWDYLVLEGLLRAECVAKLRTSRWAQIQNSRHAAKFI